MRLGPFWGPVGRRSARACVPRIGLPTRKPQAEPSLFDSCSRPYALDTFIDWLQTRPTEELSRGSSAQPFGFTRLSAIRGSEFWKRILLLAVDRQRFHSARLLSQLDAIRETANSRAETARVLAGRLCLRSGCVRSNQAAD